MKRFVGMAASSCRDPRPLGLVRLGCGVLPASSRAARASSAWTAPRRAAAASYGAAIANVVSSLMLVIVMTTAALAHGGRAQVVGACIQNRIGPNRDQGASARPLGGIPLLLADALKMLTKEDIEPAQRSRAPLRARAHALASRRPSPSSPWSRSGPTGRPSALVDAGAPAVWRCRWRSLDVGLLYVFAVASLAVYGTSLAGWASNNKLALLGGVRASSQMISYEVSLGLSLVGAMIAYRTAAARARWSVAQGQLLVGLRSRRWGIFLQPVGFLLFFAAAFAETKRAPFDLPEGESEIVGYFVEYSGMKFGMMFLAEFVEVVVLSAASSRPSSSAAGTPSSSRAGSARDLLAALASRPSARGVFWVKVLLLCWLQLVIRWTLPALPLRPDPEAVLEDPAPARRSPTSSSPAR